MSSPSLTSAYDSPPSREELLRERSGFETSATRALLFVRLCGVDQ